MRSLLWLWLIVLVACKSGVPDPSAFRSEQVAIVGEDGALGGDSAADADAVEGGAADAVAADAADGLDADGIADADLQDLGSVDADDSDADGAVAPDQQEVAAGDGDAVSDGATDALSKETAETDAEVAVDADAVAGDTPDLPSGDADAAVTDAAPADGNDVGAGDAAAADATDDGVAELGSDTAAVEVGAPDDATPGDAAAGDVADDADTAAAGDDGDPVSDTADVGPSDPCLTLNCADGNTCTADSCDGGTCVHLAAAATCDDGDACTAGDACAGTSCEPGGAAPCSDGNACTDDGCDVTTGCVHLANSATCEDGDACTAGDLCAAETCGSGAAVGCDDGVTCTTDSCAAIGGCSHSYNSAGCDDGDACSSGDICKDGICKGFGGVNCDDGNPCTSDGCDALGGCQHPSATDGSLCSAVSCAGLVWHPGAKCLGGACQAEATESCGDGKACTYDFCTASGGCQHTDTTDPCEDGDLCTENDACQGGACHAGGTKVCSASDGCHSPGTCSNGACSNPVKANGDSCEDGNLCTENDTCQGGTCQPGTLKVCVESDQCHYATVCAGGSCGNVAKDDGTGCDDGNACTSGDACTAGSCAGTAVVCKALDGCHLAGTCTSGSCSNPLAADGTPCTDNDTCTSGETCSVGTCGGGTPTVCNGNGPCQFPGSCVSGSGCVYLAKADSSTCDDGNACTSGDSCAGGVCSGTAKVCTASDGCHDVGTCSGGSCSNPAKANGSGCDDGSLCTSGDVCTGGSCAGTPAVTCTASDQCHSVGTCAAATGVCSNPTKANGTGCDDALPCTKTDVCTNGTCGGTAYTCATPAACKQSGVCAGDGTCSFAALADGTPCEDGQACTLNESCSGGSCLGSAKSCDDSDPCTTDACTAADGSCTHAAKCDDGNSCTVDACDLAATCTHTAAADATACPLGGACTGGTCISPDITVYAGGYHSCIIVGGGVQCWGRNDYGQLGDGTTTQRLTPTPVAGLTAPVTALALGRYHSCAVLSTGAAVCWGYNASGQLGTGDNNNSSAPVQVSGITSGATAIASSWDHTCAVVSGGVQCWGYNTNGQLGDSSTTTKNYPVTSGTLTGITGVAAGRAHSCALDGSGNVSCWGWNTYGQVGDATNTQRTAPVAVSGLGGAASGIAAGGWHSCAVVAGAAKCWGYNPTGQLGDATTTNRNVPTQVSGLTTGVTGISAGQSHTCARTSAATPVCWGDNTYGQVGDQSTTQRTAPTSVYGFGIVATSIASGQFHACAVVLGKYVRCWGINSNAQIGDGTTTLRPQATHVSGYGTGLAVTSMVVAGDSHSCLLKADGTVWCWGSNGNNQLGSGYPTVVTSPTPLQVPSVTSTAAIASASNCTCALATNGALKCWGDGGGFGTIGNGTTSSNVGPSQVVGITGDAIAVSVGAYHACALMVGGSVRCWGSNTHYELGDGTTTNRTAPVQVAGLTSGVTAIAAGGYLDHTCVMMAGGAQCWGYNNHGQLGDASTTTRSAPTAVSGLSSGLLSIAAGYYTTCGVTLGGGLQCWGYNGSGQLGIGSIVEKATPTQVTGLTSGTTAVTASHTGSHVCAIVSGSMLCWGDNNYGQLGDGTKTNRLMPTGVANLGGTVVSAAAGGNHTCALLGNGNVQCWGSNGSDQLGIGISGVASKSSPVPATIVSSATALAVGDYHACAVVAGGALKCWGRNNNGQLGDTTGTDNVLGVLPTGFEANTGIIAAGSTHTLALDGPGTLSGWGANNQGQLGDGTTTQRTSPSPVPTIPDVPVLLDGGSNHSCAILPGGYASCWGYNSFGQVGDGTNTQRTKPVIIPSLSSGVTWIAAGGNHTCAVVNGGVQCWGSNSNGQLGEGDTTNRNVPYQVTGLTSGVVAVDAGPAHSCAVLATGAVQCWGYNNYGQLGDGTQIQRTTPVAVTGITNAIAIRTGSDSFSANYGFSCALLTGGTVKCWGFNYSGELGNGTTSGFVTANPTPVAVLGITNAIAIRTGNKFACALLADQTVKCWGDDSYGQLGDNSLYRLTPTYAVGFGG